MSVHCAGSLVATAADSLVFRGFLGHYSLQLHRGGLPLAQLSLALTRDTAISCEAAGDILACSAGG